MFYFEWLDLMTQRTDLSDKLIHLTKEYNGKSAFDNLYDIFSSQTILASSPSTSKNERVVCFQDTPIYAIAQASYLYRIEGLFPQSENHERLDIKLKRYEGYGIRMNKQLAYDAGARPVFYIDTHKENEINQINPDYRWKAISFNLKDDEYMVDWSHEREWIYHKSASTTGNENFQFRYDQIEIIVPTYNDRIEFINQCDERGHLNELRACKGIIVLEGILN